MMDALRAAYAAPVPSELTQEPDFDALGEYFRVVPVILVALAVFLWLWWLFAEAMKEVVKKATQWLQQRR